MNIEDHGLGAIVEVSAGRGSNRRPRLWESILWSFRLALVGAVTGLAPAADAEGQEIVSASHVDAPRMVLEPKGSLVIVGGGRLPDSVRKTFIELAGGAAKAKIVVVPTAGENDDAKPSELDEYLAPWRKLGVASVSIVHTRSRDKANEPDFTREIDEATGVWFGGGDQSHITDAYLGTRAEPAFRRVLERGGVIGGTSAGAAIMSKVMITGGREKATVGTGLGYLPGAVVDQHALKRSRFNRLMGVVAEHPGLIGIAVDEATALVIRPEEWRVLGDSYVVFYRPGSPGSPQRIDFFQDGDHGKFGDWKSSPSDSRSDR
jgi:cyanophycinase